MGGKGSLSSVCKCLTITDKVLFVIMLLRHVCFKTFTFSYNTLVAQMPGVLPLLYDSPCLVS